MDARNNAVLALTFPSDREIAFTRVFDAPRHLVFEAWTKPEHVARWYGCQTFTLIACDIDLRVGGVRRLVMRGPDGKDCPMSGIYREIVPPARLVYTERFNDDPNMEALVTLVLEERDGKTTMRSTVLYRTAEDREAVLKMGTERGASETLDRLARHLVAMAGELEQRPAGVA